MSKGAYVRSQRQDRHHACHWPGCTRQVPPAMWGCSAHWFTLPAQIRAAIWQAFRPGQEKTMTPSVAYVAAARAAQEWIGDYLRGRASLPAPTPSQKVRLADDKTTDLFGE